MAIFFTSVIDFSINAILSRQQIFEAFHFVDDFKYQFATFLLYHVLSDFPIDNIIIQFGG